MGFMGSWTCIGSCFRRSVATHGHTYRLFQGSPSRHILGCLATDSCCQGPNWWCLATYVMFHVVFECGMARSYSGCISNLCWVQWASLATRRVLLAEDASTKHAKQWKPQTAARCPLNSVFLLVVAVAVAVVGPHVLLVGDCWPAMLVKSKRTLQDQQLSARRGREAVQLALQKQGAYSLQSLFCMSACLAVWTQPMGARNSVTEFDLKQLIFCVYISTQ